MATEPTEIGIFETKTHLSAIVERVAGGERFVITRRGVRIAELGPVAPQRQPLIRGCAGNDGYRMDDDFDDPLDDFGDYM